MIFIQNIFIPLFKPLPKSLNDTLIELLLANGFIYQLKRY